MKTTVVLLFIALSAVAIRAQLPATGAKHPAILLYERGEYAEAARTLARVTKSKEHKSDAELWNYLGLALLAEKDIVKGIKAFEKSIELDGKDARVRANVAYAYLLDLQVKKAYDSASVAIRLDPKNPNGLHIRGRANLARNAIADATLDADRFLTLDPSNAQAYTLMADTLLGEFTNRVSAGATRRDEAGYVKKAIDVLETGLERTKGGPGYDGLVHQLASLRTFHNNYSQASRPLNEPAPPLDPGVTPYRILNKPRPQYTEQARASKIGGTIRLSVILEADGKIGYVVLLNRLDYGLEQSAIRAARSIQFEPKSVDGKPVDTVVTIEYTFYTY